MENSTTTFQGLAKQANGQTLTRPQLFGELGTSGLAHWGGRLHEEFLQAWKSSQKQKTIKEMQTDAVVSASFLVYSLLIRQASWEIQAAAEDNLAQEHAEFARSVLFDDMSHTWDHALSETLTMLAWGWSFLEIVYKKRQGESRNPAQHSQFTDGRIGLRKLALRSQDTLDYWALDEEGGIQALHQWDANSPGHLQSTIPIEKALLFRTSMHKGSPEGQSLLRSAFISWFQKKHIAQLQAIGIERDAAGLPVVRVPNDILTLTDHAATLTAYKKLAVNLRNDEQAGVVLPSDRDEHGQYLYGLDLLSAAGAKQFDTVGVLKWLDLQILLSLMTDVIIVGHEQVGSFALASSKTSLLSFALGGIMQSITTVVNRHLMPRLWRLNGLPLATMPQLIHGDIETQSLEEISNFVLRLSQAGFQVDDLENEVRRRTGFPSVQDAA